MHSTFRARPDEVFPAVETHQEAHVVVCNHYARAVLAWEEQTMPMALYLLGLEVGNVGMPAAPILHFQGTVNAPTGKINGQAEITQSVAGPHGEIEIHNVTGQIRHLGLGHDKRVVTLEGTYVVSFPPPAIGEYLAKFSAFLVVDASWNGTGEFTYGGHTVKDVPVKSVVVTQAEAA